MDQIPQLFDQLRDVDKNISLFISYSGIERTLRNMMRHRHRTIRKIQRIQVKHFDRT